MGRQYFDNALGSLFSAGYFVAPALAALLYTCILLMILALLGTRARPLLH